MRAHKFGELSQYDDNLAALVGLKFAYAVVGFHHLGRLHKHRLAGRRFVVYDTLDAALHSRGDRHNESAVAQCGRNILLYKALTLCCTQYAI